MKRIVIALMLLLSYTSGVLWAQNSLQDLRMRFHEMDSKDDAAAILSMDIFTDPVSSCTEMAYIAATKARMAEYVKWPGTKLKYFKEGTTKLDGLIEKHPCAETKYLRLLIQLSAPYFLGYHHDIDSDVHYLVENLPNLQLTEFERAMFISTLIETNQNAHDLDELINLNYKF